MPGTATTRERDRLEALDGLRGVAALIVLVWHVVTMTFAGLATAYEMGGRPTGRWHELATSPVAILWEGPGAVTVFFVLSAFVLTRAALAAHEAGRWRASSYLVARMVRLYLPVCAAVAVGTLLALSVARPHSLAAGNLSLEQLAKPFTAGDVLGALTLWSRQPAGAIDRALWSLHWEVVFSLALPLVVLAAPALRRHAWLLIVAALVVVGRAPSPAAATFLAPFAAGIALAFGEEVVLRRRGTRGAVLLVPLAIVLLTADRWVPGATHDAGRGGALAIVGALCAVVAPLVHPATARALTGRAARWLGRRSYSLYLIHMPIMATLAYALRTPSFAVLAVVAIPLSLAAAEALHRSVERPAQRLARVAGARVTAPTELVPQPT